jgi:sRNA-binding protein
LFPDSYRTDIKMQNRGLAPANPHRDAQIREFLSGRKTFPEVLPLLQERWPAGFPKNGDLVRPLSSAVPMELSTQMGWSLAYTRGILASWKLRAAYCRAVLAHQDRSDLSGAITTEVVDEHAQQQARHRLEEIQRKRDLIKAQQQGDHETTKTQKQPEKGAQPKVAAAT